MIHIIQLLKDENLWKNFLKSVEISESDKKLHYLHKLAKSSEFNFDIADYNEKQRQLRQINQQLQRIQDPLRLELPVRQQRSKATLDLY